MNSFIKWAGSKKQLLPVISELIPQHYNRYVEPFSGSARLFFQLTPEQAILGDINKELISTYKAIKSNVESVIYHLSRFKKTKAEYYRLRKINSNELSKEKAAARFIYLNRFCFNGLYRTNQKGLFNVPFGGYKSNNLPPKSLLRECSVALKKTTLIGGSFEKTISKAEHGDFIYLDPPYSVESRRVFNEYSNFSFGQKEIESLRLHLEDLNSKNVLFMVSYAYSKEGLYLAEGFNKKIVLVRRNIAGFASNRRKSKELIITNY